MIPPILTELHQRWRRGLLLAGVLVAASVSLPILTAAMILPSAAAGFLLALAGIIIAAVVLELARKRAASTNVQEIARHLDRHVPALQDSCELLVRPEISLTPMQRLQQRRLQEEITGLDGKGLLPADRLRTALSLFLASALLSVFVVVTGPGLLDRLGSGSSSHGDALSAEPEALLRGIDVLVQPPAYLGLPERRADRLDLSAEEGSRVSWTIRTAANIDGAVLILDGEELPLSGSAADGFHGAIDLQSTLLYRLRLLRRGEEVLRTDNARLEMIRDQPPELQVTAPAAVLLVSAERPGRLRLQVTASDDHGLRSASLVATLALGSGERVEFRERRLSFGQPVEGTRVQLERDLDLAALGMEPGSELYLRVEAEDNREPAPNRSRTPTVRVIMPGGLGPSSDLAAGLPVIELPEFFRSQRQIILDTEKLLSERDSLTGAEFSFRSQLIGYDQSLLRVRYGALMGEEFEDGNPLGEDGGDDDHGAGSDEGVAFGGEQRASSTVEALPEGLVHLHDSAESATFFPDSVRTTFRAMLMEMWRAEGQLRTVRPDAALPSEYEALRLLKSVQESSRLYVQKVGFEAPPLKPDEARLTGDLSEIGDQRVRGTGTSPAGIPSVRRALDLVRGERAGGGALDASDRQALLDSRELLAAQARESRQADLRALDLIDDLLQATDARLDPGASAALERALLALLPAPEPRPDPVESAGDSLFEDYRRRLEDGE